MVLVINNKCHQCFCGWCLAVTLCCGRNSTSHIEFRREITICLLKSPMDVRKKTTGGAIANLPIDLRYDSVDHFKVSTTQGRCKICHIYVSKMQRPS